ncbi:hypothetical protein [Wenzhouxiangella sp. EGI_FJ10305]|uniref:hypothetical protein n=1 Tax=Wenzhouxiangella sp. EGI_FJ10305 TaxID=3243768 RepID=UPI0035DCD30C
MSLDDLAEKADALFEVWGQQMTYRVTPLTGDEWNPTPGPPVDYTVNGAPPMEYAQEYVDGTLVQVHDLRVSIAAHDLPVEPHTGTDDEGTTLIVDGTEYQIISVHPAYYGSSVGHYELQVRI